MDRSELLSLQKEIENNIITMLKLSSERETEMNCGFICLTDEALEQSKFQNIKLNKLKLDINSLFLRMFVLSHWKN